MRLTLRIISLIALLLSITWVVFSPAFDSAVAAVGSLATLISSFFIKKGHVGKSNQSQKVSDTSIGIQAGRDANVNNLKR